MPENQTENKTKAVEAAGAIAPDANRQGIAKGDDAPADCIVAQNGSNPLNSDRNIVVSIEEFRCTSLNEKHRKEIIEDSCVSKVIAQSAFYSTKDEGKTAAKYKTMQHLKLNNLMEYEDENGEMRSPLESGWAINCVIPYTGKEDKVAGQFKPDCAAPRLDKDGKPKLDKDGKPKLDKYLSRDGGGTPMYLKMPDANYWRNVIDEEGEKQQPIIIVEGGKKAAALLSRGHAAIALAGVYNTQDKEDKEELHEYIVDFLNPGRTVYICYDADQHTNQSVKRGVQKLARRLRKYPGVTVKNILLPNDPEAKGVDDFIKKHCRENTEALDRLIADAKEWGSGEIEEWEFKEGETTIEVAFVEAWKDNYGKDYKLTKSGWIQRGETYWKSIGDSEIEQRAFALLEKAYEYQEKGGNKFKFASNKNFKNCWAVLLNKMREEIKEDYSGIAFNNGYLDLKTREFGAVTEGKICLHGVSYDYDPTVTECPPMFLRFLESSYGLEQLEFIRAYTSWVIDTTAPWLNFPFLLGRSGSGKGALLNTWKKLLPKNTVSVATSVNPILTPEGRTGIIGKRLFVLGDFTEFISNPGAVFEMVCNEALTVRKFHTQESPSVEFYCRLVFAAVEIPNLKEKAKAGWDRRVRFIKTKEFPDTVNTPDGLKVDIEKEIAKEIPAIASWALNMDRGVRDMYLATKLNKEAHDEAEKDNNIYAQFLEEEVTAAESSDGLVDLRLWFPMFQAYAKYKNQGKDIKQTSFVKNLRGELKEENRVLDKDVVTVNKRPVRAGSAARGIALIDKKRFNVPMPGQCIYTPDV